MRNGSLWKNRSTLNEILSLKVESFLEGTCFAGLQTGSYKSFFPYKVAESLPGVFNPLKRLMRNGLGRFPGYPHLVTKALTALAGRLSLNVGCENGLEREHKTVSINP